MAVMYKVNGSSDAPVKVQCDKPVYPNKDADGEVIYENTHFHTLKEAWQKLVDEWEAGVNIDTSSVERYRTSLLDAEKRLADSCIGMKKIKRNHEEWLSKNKNKKGK